MQACLEIRVPSLDGPSPDDIRSFSHDVLKIKLSGPDYEHFSVLDLPGLFRSISLDKIS